MDSKPLYYFMYLTEDLTACKIGPFDNEEDCAIAEAALARTKDYHVNQPA